MTDTATTPAVSTAVAEALRAKLETRGPRSIQGLADQLGRERTYIHRRLSGKAELGIDDAVALARLLEVDLAGLLPQRRRRRSPVAAP